MLNQLPKTLDQAEWVAMALKDRREAVGIPS